MIKGVLLDLAGVVYDGGRAVPGSLAAVDRLRSEGLPIRFLTNTTRTPKAALLESLAKLGLEPEPGALLTPASAARTWLERHDCSPHLLIDPALREDFDGLIGGTERAVVVGDAGRGFSYATLNAAFRELDGGAAFLALATNRVFRDDDGALSLDAGAFVAALEYAARRSPVVLGKPSPEFFGAALESMGIEAGEAVMVGDDAEMDVAGALSAGLAHGLLVRTGKYRTGAENGVEPSPTAVVDDLAAAAGWILEHRAS